MTLTEVKKLLGKRAFCRRPMQNKQREYRAPCEVLYITPNNKVAIKVHSPEEGEKIKYVKPIFIVAG